ncbi:hypothetical protein QUA20_20745 [Microcoleus sp. Pol7_A1]
MSASSVPATSNGGSWSAPSGVTSLSGGEVKPQRIAQRIHALA